MVLDKDPDSQDSVLLIDTDQEAVYIQALMDVAVSISSSDFPSGTLRFKEGQVLVLPYSEGKDNDNSST